MLNAEGVAFGERLAGPGIGKNMHGGLIKEAVHAFDKKPNPIRFPESADKCYAEACAELRRLFGGGVSVDERRQLEEVRDVERFEGDEVEALGRVEEGIAGGAVREPLVDGQELK